ncbi:NfeD family protein [Comamonas endophytica]|uniref:NfeD family protein n=1 Tax=Comamonas endophytica TaxID=2949090 RepID=A0ABY6G9M0_9BURK|nr:MULTISPECIES: NfeD family protein [unclassified Acidovorax]MCD2514055.1 NfeD family protein [Acidovorax sp. D4N7]UYG51199.1 NfeD family protein [Acidovorax sp. 5MLIR]
MASFTIWWLIAGVLVVAELLTGSFYLLMLAAGAVAGAIAAHAGVDETSQILVAALLGTVAVAGCYLLRRRHALRNPVQNDRSMNLDIGESVQVDHWAADGTAQVRYRGAQWTVVLRPGNAPTPGMHRVAEIIGNRLLVDKL